MPALGAFLGDVAHHRREQLGEELPGGGDGSGGLPTLNRSSVFGVQSAETAKKRLPDCPAQQLRTDEVTKLCAEPVKEDGSCIATIVLDDLPGATENRLLTSLSLML